MSQHNNSRLHPLRSVQRRCQRFSPQKQLPGAELFTSALIVICCGLGVPAARADYAGEVLKDRPVAWWRFGDPASGNGSDVRDAVGNHPGIYHGNTSVEDGVPGIGGKAALFDGATAYVEVPNHKDFALDTLSVECWFKAKQPWTESNWPASATLISKGTEGNASSDWVILGGAAAGVQGCVIARPGPAGGNDAVVASPGGLNNDIWHHLVWTRAAGVNQLFVDGVKVSETDDGDGSILNERPIQIGGDPFLNGKFFHGRLAEVAIYQTALDESRVVAHLTAAGVSPRQPAIVAAPSGAQGTGAAEQEVFDPLAGPNVKDTPAWQAGTSATKDAEGFVALFDGKTFNGWEGNSKIWRIEAGAIVGGNLKESIAATEYLCNVRDYANFEMRVKFKAVATRGEEVNGGIQFRSRRVTGTQVRGYQADLGVFDYGPGKFWGCLFESGNRDKVLAGDPLENEKLVNKGDWNQYVIRSEGRHIQLWLNGVRTVDYTETDEKVRQHGIFGMQAHSGPPQELWYKDILIKELPATSPSKPLETLALENSSGLGWELWRGESGWSLGQISLHGKPLEKPVVAGFLALRDIKTGELRWLPAAHAERLSPHAARLTGLTKIGEVTLRFAGEITLQENLPAAAWTVSWSVDKDLDGWELCMAYHGAGQSAWRCTVYPFAGNSAEVGLVSMQCVGVPAALIYRPDLSMVALFGIDPASDYLNPTSWTGTTGFHFKSGQMPPQYRVGGRKLVAGIQYEMPLQLFLSDAGESAKAITGLVKNWIALNKYAVEPLKVRSHQEGFDLFLQGRIKGGMWHEGLGYQIMENWKVVYTAESPINAWFDYLLYEQSGDPMWRKRAFAAMDLVLKAQHTDPTDPYFGALETNYELETKAINSNDHTDNWHYKVDMNSFAARYMLQVWQRLKEKEGIDRKDWYRCAVHMADWVMNQQNPDGGLPQVVDDKPHRKSISVISGRSLAAFPIIQRITGDEKYGRFASQLEKFLRTHVEERYWFSGAHVDLYPKDFEADSVWHAVEYWIDKYDQTKDRDCLRRAEADAWFAFLMFCPKQLSWVKNPTQTCHTEQQHFLQYSNYCYNNRKYVCLDRLAKLTGEKLFGDLCERIIQCGFWAQPTSGPWVGGINERMSDPWKTLSNDFNSTAQVYTGELATDAALQLLEMGLAKPAGKPANPTDDVTRGK